MVVGYQMARRTVLHYIKGCTGWGRGKAKQGKEELQEGKFTFKQESGCNSVSFVRTVQGLEIGLPAQE